MDKPKQLGKKIGLLVLLCAVVVFVCPGLFRNEEQQSTGPMSPSQYIQSVLQKTSGSDVTVDLDSIVVEPYGYLMRVTYTFKGRKLAMMVGAGEVLKAIFTNQSLAQVQSVLLMPQTTFVDKYGAESVQQAAKLVIDRNVADKVNWDNLTSDMLENLLRTEGQLWLHPGL